MKIRLHKFRYYPVKSFVLIFFLPLVALCQDYTEEKLIARLQPSSEISPEVLSKRSVVLYSHNFTQKEINTVHENLVRTGIDAEAYFELDQVLGGWDMTKAYAAYFKKREFSNLIILQKSNLGYTIFVTIFNNEDDLVKVGQPTWTTQNISLNEGLTLLFRAALSSNQSKNYLINETPETDLPVTVIGGRRSELFPYDLKADKLAIRKFGNDESDKQLEELLKNYPLPYQMVEATVSEVELRKQGFLYILCFVHTRGAAAKTVLGYPVSPSEGAFVSVTFVNGQIQLKNIPADAPVYKYYVRHIDSGNLYLGNKWDADITWTDALKNYINGFKVELKIN